MWRRRFSGCVRKHFLVPCMWSSSLPQQPTGVRSSSRCSCPTESSSALWPSRRLACAAAAPRRPTSTPRFTSTSRRATSRWAESPWRWVDQLETRRAMCDLWSVGDFFFFSLCLHSFIHYSFISFCSSTPKLCPKPQVSKTNGNSLIYYLHRTVCI